MGRRGRRVRSSVGSVSLHPRSAGIVGSLRRSHARARWAAQRLGALNRARRRSRRMTGKKREILGAFTRCKNKRIRKPNKFAIRKRARFARSVRGVLSQELIRRTALYDYTLGWTVSRSSSAGSSYVNRSGWMQLPFRVLDAGAAVNPWGGTFVDAAAYGSGTNPAGLSPLLRAGDEGSDNFAIAPFIAKAAIDSGVVSAADQAGKIHRFMELGSRMHVNLRNCKQHGYWLDVYYIRARKNMRVGQMCGTVTGAIPMDIPTEFRGYNDYGSPLEAFALGVAQTSTVSPATLLMHSGTHIGLSDSLQFRRFYRVTKKCRVYLPPGGTFEKALVSSRVRNLKSDYVHQYSNDSATEWLVVKATPEAGAGSVDTNNRALLPAVNIGAGTDTVDIAGLVSYRFNFKQINSNTDFDQVKQVFVAPTKSWAAMGATAQVTNSLAK